jgi:hypothetical protein
VCQNDPVVTPGHCAFTRAWALASIGRKSVAHKVLSSTGVLRRTDDRLRSFETACRARAARDSWLPPAQRDVHFDGPRCRGLDTGPGSGTSVRRSAAPIASRRCSSLLGACASWAIRRGEPLARRSKVRGGRSRRARPPPQGRARPSPLDRSREGFGRRHRRSHRWAFSEPRAAGHDFS